MLFCRWIIVSLDFYPTVLKYVSQSAHVFHRKKQFDLSPWVLFLRDLQHLSVRRLANSIAHQSAETIGKEVKRKGSIIAY